MHEPRVVYPGINTSAYMNVAPPDPDSSEVREITSYVFTFSAARSTIQLNSDIALAPR